MSKTEIHRVIDPTLTGVGAANQSGAFGDYVLGVGSLVQGGAVAAPAVQGTVADMALRATDGRVAVAGTPGAGSAGSPGAGSPGAGFEPQTQQPWGFGFAQAVPPAGEGAPSLERALTLLPADAVGYTARQQDAVRRDLAGRLDDYTAYAPDPYAGACPLTGAFVEGFRGYADETGTVLGPRSLS